MKVEEWSRAALGQFSRPATALTWSAGVLLFGGWIVLGTYVYYHIGLTVWAKLGRNFYSQFLSWW